jgi:hypothetical protein
MGDSSKHPIMRDLARFGDPEATADMIESEMNMDHEVIGKNMHLTRNWLVYRTASSLKATRLTDVAWLYKYVVQRKTYGVNSGKTFQAYIWDRHGKLIQIPGKEQQVMQTLEAVAKRSPWSVIGYKKEIEQAWKKDRTSFMAAIDKRRQEMRT